MDSDTREQFREILQSLRTLRQEFGELAGSVTRLVKAMEQDDYLRERAERAEDREQDDRHDNLIKSLEDLRDRIEGVGAAHRDLPESLLRTIEKKIYELRTARWEALQSGVSNEPAPLMPAPSYREQTGKLRLSTAIDIPSDEQPEHRRLHEAVGVGVVWTVKKFWRYAVGSAVGGGITAALHKLGLF